MIPIHIISSLSAFKRSVLIPNEAAEENGSGSSGIYYFHPNCYYHEGKFFYTYSNKQNQLESTVLSIDRNLDINTLQKQGVGVDMPNATDGHKYPSIIITNSGTLIQVHEELLGPTSHNSDLLIRRAVNKDNLSEGFTSPYRISGTFCYPQLTKIGSTIFLIARASQTTVSIYKSLNDGVTWSSIGIITTVGSRLYKFQLLNPGEDKIGLVVMRRDTSLAYQPYTFVSYLESVDGQNWHNVDSTFTKDITSGQITTTELRANYAVYDNYDDGTIHTIAYAGFLLPNGNPCIMTEVGNNGSALYTFDINTVEIAYWDGSQWQKKPINVLPTPVIAPFSYANPAEHYIHGDARGNIYFFHDYQDVVRVYKSTDLGDSWSLIETITNQNGVDVKHHTMTYNKYYLDRHHALIAQDDPSGDNNTESLFKIG